MLVSVQSPEAFEKCKAQTVIQTLTAIKEFQQLYLKRQFETAGIDATAAAAIEVADQLGYSELVEEMKAEFLDETGREIVLTVKNQA